MEQVQLDVKQDQGNSILNDCVCINCQKFRHITSMCPSRKIFTLVEEEDKFFKEQYFICDKVEELVNCKDLVCVNQGLFEEPHKSEDEVSSFSCSKGIVMESL